MRVMSAGQEVFCLFRKAADSAAAVKNKKARRLGFSGPVCAAHGGPRKEVGESRLLHGVWQIYHWRTVFFWTSAFAARAFITVLYSSAMDFQGSTVNGLGISGAKYTGSSFLPFSPG